jgi:hypothetical protein
MSQTRTPSPQCCTPVGGTLSFPPSGILSLIGLWRSRQQLAALDTDQLADVGISHREATCEAARAPWDVRAHWRN